MGLSLGIAAGLICLFEFLLWPRKKLRTWRVGPVQWWLRAHIWLGLLALPLAVLHSGFRLGGPLSAATMIVFALVIASGVWGLAMQQFLPVRMLDMVGNTPLVEIAALSPKPSVHIYVKLEGQNPTGSVKDRIAKFMIEAAEREGRIQPGQTILEPTSGADGSAVGVARNSAVSPVMTAAIAC